MLPPMCYTQLIMFEVPRAMRPWAADEDVRAQDGDCPPATALDVVMIPVAAVLAIALCLGIVKLLYICL